MPRARKISVSALAAAMNSRAWRAARPRGLAGRQAAEFIAASNAITEIFLARGILHQEVAK